MLFIFWTKTGSNLWRKKYCIFGWQWWGSFLKWTSSFEGKTDNVLTSKQVLWSYLACCVSKQRQKYKQIHKMKNSKTKILSFKESLQKNLEFQMSWVSKVWDRVPNLSGFFEACLMGDTQTATHWLAGARCLLVLDHTPTYCTLHLAHCTLHTVHCTLHTAH